MSSVVACNKILETLESFVKNQTSASQFVSQVDDIFENESLSELDSNIFKELNELAVLASLYVKDPEIRKEEPSYIDERQLLMAARAFMERNEHRLR